MSKHRIEIEVEVADDVIAGHEDTGAYRGRPDEWDYLSDIDWAQKIGAIDDDPPITGYEEVKHG